jgi:hypothetical protein
MNRQHNVGMDTLPLGYLIAACHAIKGPGMRPSYSLNGQSKHQRQGRVHVESEIVGSKPGAA